MRRYPLRDVRPVYRTAAKKHFTRRYGVIIYMDLVVRLRQQLDNEFLYGTDPANWPPTDVILMPNLILPIVPKRSNPNGPMLLED